MQPYRMARRLHCGMAASKLNGGSEVCIFDPRAYNASKFGVELGLRFMQRCSEGPNLLHLILVSQLIVIVTHHRSQAATVLSLWQQ